MNIELSPHVIYGLFDPFTNQLRYIGKSSNVYDRYKRHHYPSELKKRCHRTSWIKSLLNKGAKAELKILERYPNHEDLNEAEMRLIEHYRTIGYDLVNGTDGGDGSVGRIFSEEAKRKMSIAACNRSEPCSEETKEKISKSKIGIPPWNKGKKSLVSDETRKKLSDAHKGKSSPNKGKTWKLVDGRRIYS